jgi:cytoskeletal protein RodZ
MTINRNNYEEFFLLYVDNELSAHEKKNVEVFIKENPDLQEELLMLQQSILTPDAFVFADKENLFKQDVVEEEVHGQLLLMLDNELDKTSKEKLLGLTKNDAAVKKEWELLQQTKLADERIIFKDKAILYKEESGRVVSIRWWRIAAAAMIIGLGIWGAANYTVKTVVVQPGSELVKNNKANSVQKATDKKELQPKSDNNAAVDVAQSTPVKEDKKATIAVPALVKKVTKQMPLIQKQSTDIAAQKDTKKTPDNNSPKASLQNINNNERNNYDVVDVPSSEVRNNDANKIGVIAPDNIPANEIAIQTTYIDNNSAGVEEENKGRKSKIGGFFKKIKRAVERKTNMKSDDHSFKIANMSFAMQ